MRSRAVSNLGFSFENLMWIFTRISGLSLFLLSLVGITGAFILGARMYLTNGGMVDAGALARWAFFPNPNHVVNTGIPDVTQGWSNAYWQVMEMLILFFGATHGLNGLRVVIEDYLSPSWWRALLRGLIFLIWLSIIIVGIFVILNS